MRPRARRTALGLLPGIGEKSPGTAPLRRSAKPKTPRAHRRSESQPALARPWPARQTGSKGRLKFLYPGRRLPLYTFIPELNHERRFEQVAALLASRGHGDARIAKILGGNFARVMAEVWG